MFIFHVDHPLDEMVWEDLNLHDLKSDYTGLIIHLYYLCIIDGC